jgi:neutral ceramidase
MRAAWFVPLLVACSSTEPQPSAPSDLPSRDPSHCTFEVPPTRAAKPPQPITQVRAGLGRAILPLPIGTPLGGYGARMRNLGGGKPIDARAARFATGFVPSVGQHEAPWIEALVIETGEERAVIVRADLPYVTEGTLFEIEKAASPDGALRGRILLAASHSHANYGGFQPTFHLMPGSDRPRADLAERVVSTAAEVIRAAIADLAPARIGIGVERAFDPSDRVSRDRRRENDAILGPDGNDAGKGKDPAVWALRVDRIDGTPLAAVLDLPIHGTVGGAENPLASNDVPGAIARALSEELGYPVLHVQGAAGDIAPAEGRGREACPDGTRCLDLPQMEIIGARATALLAPLVRGVQTGETAAIEIVTRSFYTGRNAATVRPDGTKLWYTPVDELRDPDGVIFGSDGKLATPIDEFATEAGAAFCGTIGGGSLAQIQGTTDVGAYSSCADLARARGIILSFFELPADAPAPFCDTVRVTGTALRISGTPTGDWLIVGAPGEPTAPWASYLRARSPAGDRTLVIGYANDLAGYLLTAEDWLAGGYEASTNLWGPLEGEIVIDGLTETARLAWTPEREDPETGSSRWTGWTYPPSTPVEATTTTDQGTPVEPPPTMWWPDAARVERFPTEVARATGVARFAWAGGDPAIDRPTVAIEREVSPGAFAPIDAHSDEGAVVITYVPEPLQAAVPTRHLYGATFQAVSARRFSLQDPTGPWSLPLGRYRFRAEGRARTATGTTPYEVVSDPFVIVAAPLAGSSRASRTAAGLRIEARVGDAPGLRALRDGPSDRDLPLIGPWSVTVRFDGGRTFDTTATPRDAAAEIALDGSTTPIEVEVRDPHGNGGTISVR